jgi:hypothetical protein
VLWVGGVLGHWLYRQITSHPGSSRPHNVAARSRRTRQ